MTKQPESLGALIQRLRMTRSLSLRELGRDIGVSGNSISGWERGHRIPIMQHLPALANALGVDVATLSARAAAERANKQQPRGNPLPYPPDDVDEQIGWRIRDARMFVGLPQWRVAKDLDVTQSQLCAWERGYMPVPKHRLEAIADLCGVSVAYLRGEVV